MLLQEGCDFRIASLLLYFGRHIASPLDTALKANYNSVMNRDSENQQSSRPQRAAKKRERTRADLLAAARKVFAQRGYHDTSILDITAAADVGVGTFYLHFRDKDEAFNTLIEEVLHSLREQVTIEVRRHGQPTLAGIVQAIFQHAYEQRDLFRIGLTSGGQAARTFHVQDMIAQGLMNMLERVAAQGQLPGYDLVLLSRLITGVITQGIIWWFEQDEPLPDMMAEQVLLLLSRGLPRGLITGEDTAS